LGNIIFIEGVLVFTLTFCQGQTSCLYQDKNSTGGSYDWSDEEMNQTSEAVEKNGPISKAEKFTWKPVIAISLNTRNYLTLLTKF
jgi:hypothetical protein